MLVLAIVGGHAGYLSAQSFHEGLTYYYAGDHETAFQVFMPLAKQGDAKAQATIALMYERGQGTPEDTGAAIKWYKKAAGQGLARVQHDLGGRYFNGTDLPEDLTEAIRWWRLAAANNIAASQYNLGLLYARGLGVERDDAQAREWFTKAAKRGHALAQFSLGVIYANGQGVKSDFSKAARWFGKAAIHGIPEAQYNLGILIERQADQPGKLELAAKWYQKAAAQGLPQARKKTSGARKTPEPHEINREPWILAQDPARLTIQLATSTSEGSVLHFINTENLGPDIAYFKFTPDDKTVFITLYGVFESYEDAKAHIERLPARLQKAQPIVRRFEYVQEMISDS